MDRGAPPVADLDDAGDVFRRERTRRRIPLSQAAIDTKIRPAILAAIEEGSIRELPNAVFARGLIRTYARYLGVDPRGYLSAYGALAPEAIAAVRPERQSGAAGGRQALPGIFVPVVVLGILLLLAGYLYQQYAAFVSGPALVSARPPGESILISTPLPSPPAVRVRTVATPVITLPGITLPLPLPTNQASTPQPTPIVTSTPIPSPTPNPIQGVHIDAVIVARVWVQVEADGKVIFAGILNPGDRKSWAAVQKIMVWSGNASSLNVTFNGKAVGSLGAPGEVVKVTWTATS